MRPLDIYQWAVMPRLNIFCLFMPLVSGTNGGFPLAILRKAVSFNFVLNN